MDFNDKLIPDHHSNNNDYKDNHAYNRSNFTSKHQHISTSTLLKIHNYVLGIKGLNNVKTSSDCQYFTNQSILNPVAYLTNNRSTMAKNGSIFKQIQESVLMHIIMQCELHSMGLNRGFSQNIASCQQGPSSVRVSGLLLEAVLIPQPFCLDRSNQPVWAWNQQLSLT